MNIALASASPYVSALCAEEGEPKHPAGVIEPYRWGERQIPVAGQGMPGTEVVDEAVLRAMRENGIVGCGISVVRNAEVVYTRGFGYAELPDKPFLPTTASRCGSVAKPVAALCALVLMDQGKLDLEAYALPILRKHGIEPKPVGGAQADERIARIRVRHLMDHTSGLPGGATYTAWRPNRNVAAVHGLKEVATSADVASDALGNTTLTAEPGAKYEYANANFVLLARVIEAQSGRTYNDYLTHVAMPRFGVKPGEIFVSRNQDGPDSSARGKTEAAYYQTNDQRFVSFHPKEQAKGEVYGEAYRGYATESSDGAGGTACSAAALGRIIANLGSRSPALSQHALAEILTPPEHYRTQPGFDPASSSYYSKGFDVRYSGGRPWLAHGGMTLHCGGLIGHNAGYQFVAVSNWNNARSPFVDSLLDGAIAGAVSKIKR